MQRRPNSFSIYPEEEYVYRIMSWRVIGQVQGIPPEYRSKIILGSGAILHTPPHSSRLYQYVGYNFKTSRT